MAWLAWLDRSQVRRAVLQAIERHGAAAEAHLNYPLQDPATPRSKRRQMRAALREIRRMKARGELPGD